MVLEFYFTKMISGGAIPKFFQEQYTILKRLNKLLPYQLFFFPVANFGVFKNSLSLFLTILSTCLPWNCLRNLTLSELSDFSFQGFKFPLNNIQKEENT